MECPRSLPSSRPLPPVADASYFFSLADPTSQPRLQPRTTKGFYKLLPGPKVLALHLAVFLLHRFHSPSRLSATKKTSQLNQRPVPSRPSLALPSPDNFNKSLPRTITVCLHTMFMLLPWSNPPFISLLTLPVRSLPITEPIILPSPFLFSPGF